MGDWQFTWPFLASAFLGYLLGSVPFGLVLTKFAGLGDIRHIGSGNIGATNVLRTGHKGLAALTLVLDGGKGTIAVLGAGYFGQDMAVLAGGGAFLGHCFPLWLRFRGGKGVATFFGVMLGLAFPAGALACLTWLAVTAILRFSSVSAIVAAALTPLYVWWLADFQRMELAIALAVILILRHRQNIVRLFKGEESKIGKKSDDTAT